jgi:hypothetical protein
MENFPIIKSNENTSTPGLRWCVFEKEQLWLHKSAESAIGTVKLQHAREIFSKYFARKMVRLQGPMTHAFDNRFESGWCTLKYIYRAMDIFAIVIYQTIQNFFRGLRKYEYKLYSALSLIPCTVLYCHVQSCTVMHCHLMSCTVMYCLVLSCTDPTLGLKKLESVSLYCLVPSCTDPTLGLNNLESLSLYCLFLPFTDLTLGDGIKWGYLN